MSDLLAVAFSQADHEVPADMIYVSQAVLKCL